MRIDSLTSAARRTTAATLLIALAACGGNDFTELLAKLITARFVPETVTLSPGAGTGVDLEITCDDAALNTQVGRLGVRYKLDPAVVVPVGVDLTFPGSVDSDGFYVVACNTASADPNLKVGHVAVAVRVAVGTPPQSAVLRVLLEVEPENNGMASKDSTSAELTIRVAEAATPG